MNPLKEELVLLILQFLTKEGFEESLHRLEQESGLFFNMSYFQDTIKRGKWDKAEKYVKGFSNHCNPYSRKMFHEIRTCKYVEALFKKENAKAVDILRKELSWFRPFDVEAFDELVLRLAFDEFGENDDERTAGGDYEETARAIASEGFKSLALSNPDLCVKLQFPSVDSSRLWTLINQSLQWQHYFCENSKPMLVIETLLVDHSCADDSISSVTETHSVEVKETNEEEGHNSSFKEKKPLISLSAPHQAPLPC